MSSVKPAEKSLMGLRALRYIQLQGLLHPIDSAARHTTAEYQVTYPEEMFD